MVRIAVVVVYKLSHSIDDAGACICSHACMCVATPIVAICGCVVYGSVAMATV